MLPECGRYKFNHTHRYCFFENKKDSVDGFCKEEDIYILRILWFLDSKRLLIQWLIRLQNKLEFLDANMESGKSSVLLTEESKTLIEEGYDAILLKSGKQFFRISDKDGYAASASHIVLTSSFFATNLFCKLVFIQRIEC